MIPAVILAGGFGTRLASVVRDRPKPMADVAGRPFLEHLLDRLQQQGVRRAVLATGHMSEIISGHFGHRYRDIDIQYSHEDEPLGTGGAARQAFAAAGLERALLLNGDTYCTVDLNSLCARHEQADADITLTLISIDDASRYGAVKVDAHGHVIEFLEKSETRTPGLINAGVYVVERRAFDLVPAQHFSFERELLAAHTPQAGFAGHACSASFIDIGVPEDYRRAQTLFAP